MEKNKLKILFMGTPEFAKASLDKIILSGFDVCAVFTKPDMPNGRKMQLIFGPVKEYAIQHDILVFQPEKMKSEETKAILAKLQPDVIVVAAYGKILPKYILDLPKFGCINVHGSLLPKYRGAAPVQWAVINGEKVTGVTIMYMNEGMDTGDIIDTASTNIAGDDTYGTIYDKLKILGANKIVETLEQIVKEETRVKSIKQVGEYSLAPIIDKNNSKIDFTLDGQRIVNLIRGTNPEPMAWCKLDEDRQYKIYKASNIVTDKYNQCATGEVVELQDRQNIFYVKCGDGVVNILELKPAGGKQMKVADYIRGNKIKVGEKFI